MAARKLQTEIDKTLKKVAEGVEQFEDQYKKIQQSSNVQHKDKLEAELKTQIKKLQRLRDQIKTWLASNEIKDKKALVDNRKLIELQMERFKACEKEMKTKAFSKEGLSAGQRLDPREQLKVETAGFITNMVDELSRQVETTEAEVEQLQGGAKKGKKDTKGTGDRVAQMEELNDRRNWHIGRLELILRLMENGNLEPDRVQSLKEDISYFVESNTEEDFDEDEGIYDELNLDEEEETFGNVKNDDDIQSSHDSMSVADTSDMHTAPPSRTPVKKASAATALAVADEPAEKSPTTTKAKAQRKPTLDGTAVRPTGLATPARSASTSQPAPTPVTTAAPTGPAPRAVPAVLPPIRYSAAAASAVNPPASASLTSPSAATTTPQSVQSPSAITSAPSVPAAGAATSAAPPTVAPAPSQAAAPLPSPEVAKNSIPTSSTTNSSEVAPSPAISHASGTQANLAPQSTGTNGTASATSILSPSQQAASVAPLQALEIGSQPQQQQPSSPAATSGLSPSIQDDALQAGQQAGQTSSARSALSSASTTGTAEPRLPSSLADLVTSFESAKQKSLRRDNDLSSIHNILETGYSNIPQPADAEKPKYYIPRNAYPTPPYYPQQPSPHLANPALFAKFDVDTLFYIFYYCQGTYMQYLAAQELKKQSWRFHKQYLTWFQRANEPQSITDEYEEGVYLYFDFEGSWAQRRKENFAFQYRHLEE